MQHPTNRLEHIVIKPPCKTNTGMYHIYVLQDSRLQLLDRVETLDQLADAIQQALQGSSAEV